MSLDSFILLCVALLLYAFGRSDRDYYVLQRFYYDRLYEPPWRGKLFGAHYIAFESYLAAKTAFDLYETEWELDTVAQEAEHKLFMVSAKSKSKAINRLKVGKAYDKELLHYTQSSDIRERRKAAKETYEALS